LPDDAIVVARDLTPSDTAQLDKSKVRAFLTEVGSKTSHSAIMARSMGIPAVLGIQNLCEKIVNGSQIIVDGFQGLVFLNPSHESIGVYQKKIATHNNVQRELLKYRDVRLAYSSERKITVAGNIGAVEEMDELNKQGAQGVGLFRTEFLFMGRKSVP